MDDDGTFRFGSDIEVTLPSLALKLGDDNEKKAGALDTSHKLSHTDRARMRRKKKKIKEMEECSAKAKVVSEKLRASPPKLWWEAREHHPESNRHANYLLSQSLGPRATNEDE